MERANKVASWTIFMIIFLQQFSTSFLAFGVATPGLLQELVADPITFLMNPLMVVSLFVPLSIAGFVLVRQLQAIKAGTFSILKSVVYAVVLFGTNVALGLLSSLFIFVALFSAPNIDEPAPLILNLIFAPLFLMATVYFWTAVLEFAKRSLGINIAQWPRAISGILAVVYGIVGVLAIVLIVGAVQRSNEYGAGRAAIVVVGLALIVKAMYHTSRFIRTSSN